MRYSGVKLVHCHWLVSHVGNSCRTNALRYSIIYVQKCYEVSNVHERSQNDKVIGRDSVVEALLQFRAPTNVQKFYEVSMRVIMENQNPLFSLKDPPSVTHISVAQY